MASRTERRRQAREQREAAERAEAAAARRRRRVGMLAGVVVIAVVLIVVGIVVSTNGSRRTRHLGPGGRSAVAATEAELAGIPERGTTLGRPDAKVTLSFFGDLQCPICAAFATGTTLDGVTGGLPAFIAGAVRSGAAKVVYHSLCTATCGDFQSRGPGLFAQQQTAAYAAGAQNRFWYYEQLFYREQGPEGSAYVTPAFLDGLARQTPGLSFARWMSGRGDPGLLSAVQSDEALADRRLPVVDGGRGTPGLIMSGPRGTRFIAEGIVDAGALQAAYAAVSS